METLSTTVFDHYVNNSSFVAGEPGICLSGSRNLMFTGPGRSQTYKGPAIINAVTGGRLMFNAIDGGYASLGNFNTAGIGNIFGLIARALGIIGSGQVYINGVDRSISASTVLQILLYVSGSYTGTGTGPFTAGLEPPTAPTLEVTAIVSTIMAGTYSTVHWFVRGATGGRSRRSTPSAVVVNSGFKLRHTISEADFIYAASVGADRVGIGGTAAGFGATGPDYEVIELAITTIKRASVLANITSGTPNLVVTDGAFTVADEGSTVTIVGAGAAGIDLTTTILTWVSATAVTLAVNAGTTKVNTGFRFNSYAIEYADASLVGKDLAPILDYPPPAAPFGAALEDVVAVIGCYGDTVSGVSTTSPGTAIAVSLPVFIESFPPDSLLFLPAPPKGVLSRAADGFVFVGGEGYVAALLYTGGRNPLSLRVIWPTTGIASPNAWHLGEGGRLYVASSKRGLIRIDSAGEPATDWAMDVVDDTASWTMSSVVTGYDGDHNRDIFCHAQIILAFNPQREKWDTPIDVSGKIIGNICSCVPVSGGLLLAANDGSTIRLYTFNSSTGMTYQVYGEIHLSQAEADELLRVELAIRSDTTNAVTVKIFTNGDTSTSKDTRTITPTATRQHLRTQKPNVRGAKSHQIYLSQACGTGDSGPDAVRIRGTRSNVS